MKFYFRLQYKMLNRHLSDFGLNPLVGYLFLLSAYAGLSCYLFAKTEFAKYIYTFAAISLILKLSETNRNEFLRYCFSHKKYLKIRFVENAFIAIPFFIFLVYKGCYISAAALLFASGFLAYTNFDSKFNYTIPTPFYKQPFEFIVGFRKAFYVFFFSYFLTFMAILVGNFNLGIFSLLLIFLMCLSFYSNTESEFYVWIYSLSPKQFLFNKIKTALLFLTILCLPTTISLCIFFTIKVEIILGLQGLGYLYLLTIILAKYSAFPKEMNLQQGFFIAFSMLFPPLLVGVIPYFYTQATKRLNEFLA